MKKLKLTYEKYQGSERYRSWGACQENDNSDSAYETRIVDRWCIKLDGSTILDDIRFESHAQNMVKWWSLTPTQIRGCSRKLRGNLTRVLRNFSDMAKAEIKHREREAMRRHRILSKGLQLPPELEDLSAMVPHMNVLEKIEETNED